MLGRNAITKPRWDEATFLVADIFKTIQGEGPFQGRSAVFLRLAGCNLRCRWCDTEFEPKVQVDSATLTRLLARYFERTPEPRPLLVITGGEPLLHPLPLLFQAMEHRWGADFLSSLIVQIETAGSVWPRWPGAGGRQVTMLELMAAYPSLMVVLSPKTPKLHFGWSQILHRFGASRLVVKYVIESDAIGTDGLPTRCPQSGKDNRPPARLSGIPPSAVYVQGCTDAEAFSVETCDEGMRRTRANQRAAARVAMQYGYVYSTRCHIDLGLK